MTAVPIKMFTSWSWSRLQDYHKCPLKAKLKHLDKIKEPSNDAMERGSAIHKMAEDYVLGKLRTLPAELRTFKDEFAKLKKMYKAKKLPVAVEGEWAFASDWSVTDWRDWVGAWVRIKIDCTHFVDVNLLVVTDWKTGKMDDRNTADYLLQLDLYALAALLMHQQNKDLVVAPRIGYLDHGVTFPAADSEPILYTQKDLPRLIKEWGKRVKPMMADKRFAPKPNSSCKWCYYSKAKNGNCKF